MIQILSLNGKDKLLYKLVAHIVMDPAVLRANHNYPFKTDYNFVWFLAMNKNEVLGFIPIEKKKKKKVLINNYYISNQKNDREEILSLLLNAVTKWLDEEEYVGESVTLIQDQSVFEKFSFASMEKKWIRYIKMTR